MPFVAIRQRMVNPAAVVAFVALWGAVACQGGGIQGRVQDRESRPVSGATITWVDGETSRTTTAGDGAFEVRLENVGSLSQGRFPVSAAGYKTATEFIGDGPCECVC
jgi:carboxypeptidase family protein